MNKQTNAQETLKRGKGKYKGDEDKLKSSTQNPEKELSIYIETLEIIEWMFKTMLNGNQYDLEHKSNLDLLKQLTRNVICLENYLKK